MVRRTLGVLSVLIASLLAGCVGGQPDLGAQAAPDASGPAQYDASTGGIDGLVVDDELVAIAGAEVGLLESGQQTRTGVEGRFSFSSLAPGTYTVVAQKIGYESKPQMIEVASGQSNEVSLTLTPLAIEEPYPETLIFDGVLENGVGAVRTATCTSCVVADSNTKTIVRFPSGRLPKDYAGILIESTWKSRDYIGIDVTDRQESVNELYWRTRSPPGVHFLLEKCASYVGAPHYGRNPMPCLDDNVSASRMHVEHWYIGEFQEETHSLDEVCRTPIGIPGQTPLVNGYPAGCYGLGVAPELRFTTYVTIFHIALPSHAADATFLPDS